MTTVTKVPAVAIAALLINLAFVRVGLCHDRTTSFSTWDIADKRVTLTLRLSDTDVEKLRLPSAKDARDRALLAYVNDHLTLTSGGASCRVAASDSVFYESAGYLTLHRSFSCPPAQSLSIRSDLFLEVIPSHLHFVRLNRQDIVSERVLSASDKVWELRNGVARSTSAVDFAILGIKHIATGYDHLVFLAAVLLIGGSLLSMVKVATAFTVAHSITLALSVYGMIRPTGGFIEALIGLSIVLVSVENVWLLNPRGSFLPYIVVGGLLVLGGGALLHVGKLPPLLFAGLALYSACYYPFARNVVRKDTVRWAIVFMFGLIHGFAFASVLVQANLPPYRLVKGLLGFNVGVELGQLALIVLTWPLLRFLISRFGALVVEVGSATTLALGIFWFATRAYR